MLITHQHFKNIYNNNNIYITCLVLIINNQCNANCEVCLAQQIFKSPLCKSVCEAYETCHHLRCCDHNTSDEDFYSKLHSILSTINSKYVNIIITGGEPTISNRFLPVLDIINQYNYLNKEVQLETNGANLKDPQIIAALKKYNVKIHLSRYTPDDDLNYKEFNFKHHSINNNDIKEFSQIYEDLFNISTIILKKYIACGQDILNFIDFYKNLNIHHYDFLEVMADTSLEHIDSKLIDYYKKQLITADALRQELLNMNEVEEYDNFLSESYGISYYKYKDTTFTITYSKLNLQHKQETNNQFSRFLIMPSGEIGVNGIEKR